MKVLVLGGHGKLGAQVLKQYPMAVAPTHSQLDITNNKQVLDFFLMWRFDLIIHLAAMTTIPACEEHKVAAWETNVEGTKNIVEAAHVIGAKVVYMSTPCVFSGKSSPYYEDSVPDPQNYYGQTKLLGETIVLNGKADGLVIRSNFLPYKKWEPEKAFIDRFSNYLFAHDLAAAIYQEIELWLKGPDSKIVHIVGSENLSMYQLSQLCPDSKGVKEYTLEEYYAENPGAGKLTKDMSLSSTYGRKHDITQLEEF